MSSVLHPTTNLEAKVFGFMFLGDGEAQLYPQLSGSPLVSSYDSPVFQPASKMDFYLAHSLTRGTTPPLWNTPSLHPT
jgi:hypothetical protein